MSESIAPGRSLERQKMESLMQKISTCLWFDGRAEEAVEFYKSVFKSVKVGRVLRWPEGSPNAGQVLTIDLEMEGREIMFLNGGPQFTFSEAISLVLNCKDQKDLDHYWDALLADGGTPSMCGWLKDKFGLSWQVVPEGLVDMFLDPDKAKAGRAMAAMMTQQKLDIEAVRKAAAG
jgi:predicted 3-demethylubiquinone-9 3-methyltransferase (glyoxalase superfamily)